MIQGYFLKISINFGFSIIFSVNPIFHINHMMLYTKGIFLLNFLLSHHYSNNQVNHEKATKYPHHLKLNQTGKRGRNTRIIKTKVFVIFSGLTIISEEYFE